MCTRHGGSGTEADGPCPLSSSVCSVVSDSLQAYELSPPGFSVRGIFQARMPKCIAFPSPGDLPDPKTKPTSLISPALAGGFFITSMMWEALRKLTENQCSLPKREVSSLYTTETVPSSSLEPGQVSATPNPSIVQNCILCFLWATHIP